MSEARRVGVIGAGAWGTALAQICARAGLEVALWAREAEVVEAINATHENALFLPGVALDPAITATAAPQGLAGLDLIFAAPPAQHLRATLQHLAPSLEPEASLVICAKGVEAGTLKLMSEVAAEVLPGARIAVLSGPSFAEEVARGLPTAVTLATRTETEGQDIASAIASPTFRPYLSADLIGAQAGGAVKNVLAIACGVAEGRALGASAKAALITRGFAEMTRLAVAMGAQARTLAGLCGLGDLVLTCGSTQSRNMSLGLALGRGQSAAQALAGKRSVAEGAASAPAGAALAARLGVEAPICLAVAEILAGDLEVDAALTRLLSRPLRSEI
ncbi:MAG: NAD(P)-dependent glycerol-3-phosphate dehydrogenase [Alphaproteobacteria bacterium]|nr:NAD(P)-dependent glycerol-3-phosphate dehydrogenase [Alphaproteobacteria bacterium]